MTQSMTAIQRVSPQEASDLLEQGYTFVDVRTEEEFEQGHVPGALNVPIMVRGAGGLQANPEFVEVMRAVLDAEAPIVVGCRSGGRSLRAAQELTAAGYARVTDLRTGWDGCRDAFGRPEAGWSRVGLPVEMGAPDGQRYAELRARRGG